MDKDGKGTRRIEFTAAGESLAGIEFYSWDFSYDMEKGFKPGVIIDKKRKQVVSLKPGAHHIAAKAVGNGVRTYKITGG